VRVRADQVGLDCYHVRTGRRLVDSVDVGCHCRLVAVILEKNQLVSEKELDVAS